MSSSQTKYIYQKTQCHYSPPLLSSSSLNESARLALVRNTCRALNDTNPVRLSVLTTAFMIQICHQQHLRSIQCCITRCMRGRKLLREDQHSSSTRIIIYPTRLSYSKTSRRRVEPPIYIMCSLPGLSGKKRRRAGCRVPSLPVTPGRRVCSGAESG